MTSCGLWSIFHFQDIRPFSLLIDWPSYTGFTIAVCLPVRLWKSCFCTITPLPFDIQWWFFTYILTLTWGGPLLIFGQRIKGQCHIWSSNFESFPNDIHFFLPYNNDTSQMYWPWPEKDLSRCGVNRLKTKRKRKRSDSVLWQKPLHQQKCQKGKVTTQTTPQKSSIKQRLRTDLGRSVGVTTATQLVWLTGLRAHLPTNRNSRLIKRTHN